MFEEPPIRWLFLFENVQYSTPIFQLKIER
jgi:hypothetical protein